MGTGQRRPDPAFDRARSSGTRSHVGRISSVGVFETTDGGKTWETRNKGVRADFYPGDPPEFGQCVHKMLIDPAEP